MSATTLAPPDPGEINSRFYGPDTTAALVAYTRAIDDATFLSRTYKEQVQWQADLAKTLERAGDAYFSNFVSAEDTESAAKYARNVVHTLKDDLRLCGEHYNRVLPIRRLLADAEPRTTEAQAQLSVILEKLGRVAMMQKAYAESEAPLIECLTLRKKIASEAPMVKVNIERLANAYKYLSKSCAGNGKQLEALRYKHEEFNTWRKAAVEPPDITHATAYAQWDKLALDYYTFYEYYRRKVAEEVRLELKSFASKGFALPDDLKELERELAEVPRMNGPNAAPFFEELNEARRRQLEGKTVPIPTPIYPR